MDRNTRLQGNFISTRKGKLVLQTGVWHPEKQRATQDNIKNKSKSMKYVTPV